MAAIVTIDMVYALAINKNLLARVSGKNIVAALRLSWFAWIKQDSVVLLRKRLKKQADVGSVGEWLAVQQGDISAVNLLFYL